MSKKEMMMALGGFLLVLALMGVGFFMMWQKMDESIAQIQPVDGRGGKSAGSKVDDIIKPTYKLETLIVNLADQGGKRYLRVTMELELGSAHLAEEISKKLPQLRDAILMILPSKTYDDIGTTEGKIALRDELMAKINTLLKKGAVTTIFFTEFVVQ